MAKAMVESIVDVGVGGGVVLLLLLLLMLLLIILLILFACKPWRFFLSSSSRTRITIINPSSSQVDDIERPLVSEDLNLVQNQSNEFGGKFSLEGVCHSTEGHFSSPQTHGVGYRQRIPSTSSQLSQSGSFVLDVIPDPLKDIFIGQTLKHPKKPVEEERYARNDDLKVCPDSGSFNEFIPEGIADERSSLTLEIISGPSRGLRCSIQSTDASRLPLILGRVAPSELLLKDSEVSGKHKLKWEVVDMGSLNGTLLNSQAIHHLDSTSRRWGLPTDLANGDIITLGTSTKIFVQITSQAECLIPFGVGLASDPMAVRRGGKKLPMEDVYYYRWPLPGADKFGIFGICDGHGGAGAATSASKILPEVVASILSDSFRRENVLSQCDASDVLRDAFLQTEASLNHYYEGYIDGKQIKMSEDHRIASYSERLRMQETGEPLKDGETRLCGLNLGRMLGDKFLKQQDARFSSEPYISQVVHIHQASRGFALIASDGFWDVVNSKKANQLVQQARERYAADRENPAEKVASFLLSEARTQRTKDNTSIIFLDFDNINRNSSLRNSTKKRPYDDDMAKKKKRAEAEAVEAQTEAPNAETELELVNGDSHDTKQKKNKKKKKKSENEKDHVQPKEIPTVSIAVPGSIIDNAQSLELATRLAGQIARAATIFRIDEVVVFDNNSSSVNGSSVTTVHDNSDDNESGAAFLIRILQYLETPQYLRKSLFPKHNTLRFVGLLPPLDAPHHLRKHEWAPYREGVTLKEQAPNFGSTLIDVGLSKNVLIDTVLEPGVRVTVAMGTNRNLDADLPRQVVSSSQPREELGMYWGYKVRYASSISSVFNDSPYKGGYDHLIGTSEHGLFTKSSELTVPSFRHLLIAFGGLAGLEESIEEDNNLKGKNAQEIFDSYLNTCPNQGSRTIRTELSLYHFSISKNQSTELCRDLNIKISQLEVIKEQHHQEVHNFAPNIGQFSTAYDSAEPEVSC
ncbi:unnamed protein product [Camellia sinensis]